MRAIVVASLVVVAAMAAGVAMSMAASAEAASLATATGTPTPATATPTPSISPTATPTITQTPVTSMFVSGTGWVDVQPRFDLVTAMIGDTPCATARSMYAMDGLGAFFYMLVPSERELPGCGVPGAAVRFVVDGRPARETVAWQARGSQNVRLTVGLEFAEYHVSFTWQLQPDVGFRVIPAIDGRDCAYPTLGSQGLGPAWTDILIVVPDEVRPGCGVSGRAVHFVLRSGDMVVATAAETAAWQPGAVQELFLTFSPVGALPTTGAGPRTQHAFEQRAAFALAAAAIVCIVAGWRCRRPRAGERSGGRRAGASRSA
jgi:hypothetical protein